MKRRYAIEVKGFFTDMEVNTYLSKTPGLIEDRIYEHPLVFDHTTYITAPIGLLRSLWIALRVGMIEAQTHGKIDIFQEDKP